MSLLQGRSLFVWDSESHLIRPGLLAPPLVCVTALMETYPEKHPTAWTDRTTYVEGFATELPDGRVVGDAILLNKTDAVEVLREALLDPTIHFVGHNIAFDWGVLAAKDKTLLPLIFKAYEDCRVSDTRIREKLIRLAMGQLTTDFSSGKKRQSKFNMGTIFEHRWNLDLSEDKAKAVFNDDGTLTITGDVKAWRLRFAELENVPLDQWPEKARDYALGDAYKTHKMFWAQVEDLDSAVVDPDTGFVTNEFETAAAAWALQLAGIWGVRTDPVAVSQLAEKLRTNVKVVRDLLADPDIGVFRLKDGTKDMKRLKQYISDAYDGAPPAPKKSKVDGAVSTEKEVLLQSHPDKQPHVLLMMKIDGVMKQVSTPILHALASISADEHNGNTYIPAFSHGAIFPINAGWNELVESGRTSCFGPNWQNLPREGGFRECVVPRPGWVFINADYSTIELCALAQFCLDEFKYSDMAVALQAGKDLHLDMATDLINVERVAKLRALMAEAGYDEESYTDEQVYMACGTRAATYEDVLAVYESKVDNEDMDITFKMVKSKRQMSKALNFGFPGGLGAETLIIWAWKTYRVKFGDTHEEAVMVCKDLKARWLAKWREMRDFFRYISKATAQGGGECTFTQPRSGRLRGGTGYCDGCNTHFQGLAADGAKASLFYVAQECYTGYSPFWTEEDHGDVKSPLFGARITIFVHDELVGEALEEFGAESAERMAEVMRLGMQLYIPDIPISAKPVLMRRWYKDAEGVRDAEGKLVPWEPPEKKAA